MGETRVDLLRLLEDLRDAYPGSAEETILTELITNTLDSGATGIDLWADPAAGSLTAVDRAPGHPGRVGDGGPLVPLPVPLSPPRGLGPARLPVRSHPGENPN
jgi:hypothetical protein